MVRFLRPTSECPFDRVHKLKETRTPRYVPPYEDFQKVLDVAEGQDKVLLQTLYYTGGRKNEIFNLNWKDIFFDKNRIRLWTNKRAGGNSEYEDIILFSDLKKILEEWRIEQPYESEYVFLPPPRSQPDTVNLM